MGSSSLKINAWNPIFIVLTALVLGLEGLSSLEAQVITSSKYCPAEPPTTYTSVGTFYTNLVVAPGTGNCAYPVGSYDPNLYAAIDGFTANDYQNGLACGACVAVHDTANGKSVTVMIVDQCGNCSNAHQIDMAPQAFGQMASTTLGQINITWNFTQCPLSLLTNNNPLGNITYQFKYGCNPYYSPIQFMDYLFPITAVQVSNNGGAYTSLAMVTSDAGNTDYWGAKSNNYNMGTGPYSFILTDVRNDSITLGPVTACSFVAPAASGITGVFGMTGVQFPACVIGPTNTPAPTLTPTRTFTPAPPTMTFTPSLTYTPGSPTATFTITPTHSSSGCTVTSATLTYMDDDEASFYINGNLITSCTSNAGAGGSVTCWGTPQVFNIPPALLTNYLGSGQNVLGVEQHDLYYNYAGATWDLLINFSCCPSREIISDGTNTRFLNVGYTNAPVIPPGWSNVGFNDSAWPTNFGNSSTNLPWPGSLFSSGVTRIPWLGPVSFIGGYQEYLFRQTFNITNPGTCATATPVPNLTIQKSILGPTSGITSGQNVTFVITTCNNGGPYSGPVTVSDGLYYTSSGGSFGENGLFYKNWNTGLPDSGLWTHPPAGPNFYGDWTSFSWVYPVGFPGNGYCDSVTMLCLSNWFSTTSGPCSVLNNAILTRAGAGPVTSNTVKFTTNAVCGSPTPDTFTPTQSFSPTRTSTSTSTSTSTITPTFTRTTTSTLTSTFSNTFSSTSTSTTTRTSTPTLTLTKTLTSTSTATSTNISTSTGTWTSTSTFSSTYTVTAIPTLTSTKTFTSISTATSTNISTSTGTWTSTSTFSPSNTATPSPTRSLTPTPTTPSTQTPTRTPTLTFTSTYTSTTIPSPTNTDVNTPTSTKTSTATSTTTLSPTPTISFTRTFTATPTITPTPTSTNVITPTPTRTSTGTPTTTLSPTPSPTTSFTRTFTATPSPTGTATSTITSTPTNTNVITPTQTKTTTATPTPTLSPTRSPTPSFTPTSTSSSSPTATMTHTSTITPTQTLTKTITFTGTFTSTATWTPSPPPGAYTVRVGVYNEAGELVDSVLVEQGTQPLGVISLGGHSSITSLNGADKAVTVFAGNVPLGTWNGLTSGGTPVTNGNYYLKVDEIGPTGVDVSTTEVVNVNRALSTTTLLVYNAAGEVVKHLFAVSDDTGQTGGDSLQLSSNILQPGTSGPGVPNTLTLRIGNGTTLVWNGTNDSGDFVASGQYFLEIHTTGGNGGETTVVKQVTVNDRDAGDGLGAVTARPNVLKISSGSAMVTFHCDSSQSLTLFVSIYTVSGELVEKTSGSTGTNQAFWNAADFASGTYLGVVEVEGTNGNGSERRILKIVVLH